MNKKLKLILLIFGCVLFISLVIISTKVQYDNEKAKKEAEEIALKEAISNMNQINVDEFVELFSSKDTKIILVASLTCPHCTALKPKLNKIVGKLNIEVNYLEISTLTKDEEKKFKEANDFMKENTYIPLVIAVKDNVVIDSFTGNISEEEIEKFLKKNLNIE